MFKIDSEFALALLGIFSVLLIVGIILFVSQHLGIQTYGVLQVGSPCENIFCLDQKYPSQETSRDWENGIAYCSCDDGKIIQAKLFS